MTNTSPINDTHGADDAVVYVETRRRTWAHWLSVILSIFALVLCALLPISRGERVYQFLLEFREKYTEHDWAMIVACRWLAWFTLIIAAVQVGIIIVLLLRPRRRTLVASYIGIALLVALFVVWAYFMAPSAALLNAIQKRS